MRTLYGINGRRLGAIEVYILPKHVPPKLMDCAVMDFAAMGIGYGDGIGIICRNHRGFVEATLAAAKLGASALYLNTMFAGPQLAEATRREGPKALVYDEEFADLLEGVDDSVARVVNRKLLDPPSGLNPAATAMRTPPLCWRSGMGSRWAALPSRFLPARRTWKAARHD